MKVTKLNMSSALKYWFRHTKQGDIVLVTVWGAGSVVIIPYGLKDTLPKCVKEFLEQVVLKAIAGSINGISDEVKRLNIVKKTSDVFSSWWRHTHDGEVVVYISKGSVFAIFLPSEPKGEEYPSCVQEFIEKVKAYGLAGIEYVS